MKASLKKQNKHMRIKTVTVIFGATVLYIVISLLLSRFFIATTTYQYDAEKITAPVKIAVLTDVHANAFGEDNDRLVKKVSAQEPDLILIVGDAFNSYSPDTSFLLNLVSKLQGVAPIYFSIGNHELAYLAQNGMSSDVLREELRRVGCMFLDQSYEDITIRGQELRIGGLFDYTFNNTDVPQEQYNEKGSYIFLNEYCDTDAFKIMLTHRPESYLTDAPDARWSIDLALCGHEHGGQVRLPVLGGFYSTHLGLFSPYMDGYHIVNGIPVVVSRGLGTYYSNRTPPRLNNIPELLIVELS